MTSLVTPPDYYFRDDLYALEKENIFFKVWQFAGFSIQLQQHNDFITFNLCGKEIVVQNFQGELRAFANVCSHRYARIQNEPCGNRLLQCPYHGWTYNKEGIPIGIPCKEDFNNLDKQSLALEQYKVELCGQLVFVNLDQNSPPLKKYLGDLFHRFESMASSFDQCIDTHVVETECNWKLPVENSLEGYHVSFVHPHTIKKFEVGVDTVKERKLALEKKIDSAHVYRERFLFAPPHSYLVDEVSEVERTKWLKASKLIGPMAGFKATDYSQHHMFPNFNLATFYGAAYFMQVFRPVTPTKCIITHYSLSARLQESTVKSKLIYSQILPPMVDLGKKILDEDVAICLKIQQGVTSARATGIFSCEEVRVLNYQQYYMNYMNNPKKEHKKVING